MEELIKKIEKLKKELDNTEQVQKINKLDIFSKVSKDFCKHFLYFSFDSPI